MKKALALLTIVALSPAPALAGGLIEFVGHSHTKKYSRDTVSVVDLKQVNCDQIIGRSKKDFVLVTQPGGRLVVDKPTTCLSLDPNEFQEIFDFAFFEPRGLNISTRGGLCKVWSCSGVQFDKGRGS